MSAMATVLHGAPQIVAAVDAVLVRFLLDQQLDGDPEQQQAADELAARAARARIAAMTREDDAQDHAAPAPRMMPQTRCRGGRARQASAMTMALSPESRMLIQMILRI